MPLSETNDEGAAVAICDVSHRYGDRQALAGVSFTVRPGEIFGLLGPNGGGKSTLFRLMATLLPVQSGQVDILGCDVQRHQAAVRTRIGVTFQSPSLDGKLTVRENLYHQSHLYGIYGGRARQRISDLTDQFGLADHFLQRVDTLSGGLKRRVEIAKSLLHSPQLLLLDEPSTGLDPGARRVLWSHLQKLRDEQHVTILVTTHLMDEAERCGRVAILDRGRLVTIGAPEALRGTVGGDCLRISAPKPAELASRIAEQFSLVAKQVDQELRIEHPAGHEILRDLVVAYPEITSIVLSKPTLEDVFIARTGHRFEEELAEDAS